MKIGRAATERRPWRRCRRCRRPVPSVNLTKSSQPRPAPARHSSMRAIREPPGSQARRVCRGMGRMGRMGGGELAGWTVNFLSNSQQELFGKQGGGEQAASLRQGVSLPTNLAVTGGGRSASARLSSRRSLSRAAGCPGHDSRVSQQHGEWASRPHCPWDANGRAACLMSLASHGPWRPESATP